MAEDDPSPAPAAAPSAPSPPHPPSEPPLTTDTTVVAPIPTPSIPLDPAEDDVSLKRKSTSPTPSPLKRAKTLSPSPTVTHSTPILTTTMPPPPLLPPSRENLQLFSISDLPKDDDGMMRWLAHRVRDSALDSSSQHSPDPGAGEYSDPETRAERERVRAENRERKKKWREENSDRNKDNDLRGRVSRRANKLFGPSNSEKKRLWMEDEFHRRKSKREFKTQLKKHETPGSSCWNSNDDFGGSNNASQVMAGVLTNQEGAAENLRNWIESGEIDYETWNAACARIWGDPGMRSYLEEIHLEETAGDVEAEKGMEDGLASKFDAAFDAIIGRREVGGAIPPVQQVEEVVEEVPEEVLEEQIDIDMIMASAEAVPPVDEAQSAARLAQISQMSAEDLSKMIESGEMSFDDIAALEAMLQAEAPDEDLEIQDLQGEETLIPDHEIPEEVQDMDLSVLQEEPGIDDFSQHLNTMSPNTRDAFIATIMGHEAGIDDMQLDAGLMEGIDMSALAEGVDVPLPEGDIQIHETQEIADDIPLPEGDMQLQEAGDDTVLPDTEETQDIEAEIMEILATAGIRIEGLHEDLLRKFLDALGDEARVEAVLLEMQAAQADSPDPIPDHQPETLEDQENPDEGLEYTAPSGSESGYDDFDDDFPDLTPDMMRIILQSSGISLPDSGDAHTLQPTPLLPQPSSQVNDKDKPVPKPSSQRQPSAYAYSPSKYSYGGYAAYGYQRRPEVQVLPPGYTAYSRPLQEAPRVDFGHLIKPLAWDPRIKPKPNNNANTGVTESNGDEVKKEDSVEVKEKEEKKGVEGWKEIFKFKIPIPSFLTRGAGRRMSEQEKMEEERNVKALGFPPMITELKMVSPVVTEVEANT